MKILNPALLVLFFLLCISNIIANTDKYRLVLTDDPATTITIGWNQVSGNNPIVYYGTQDFNTNYASYPNSKTVDKSVRFKGMNNRFAKLTGLTPNTIYYFVIKDSQSVSRRFWFKTAPNDLSRLSFVAGGDSRNNRVPRQNANKLVAKLKPNAVLFGGDMTNLDTNGEWRDWFDDWQLTTATDGRMFPIVPTRGNHENARVVYNLFNIPNIEEYYALTFGNNLVRTYTLNTEIATNGDQQKWLNEDVKQHKDVIWKSAQYHKPMRPHVRSKSEGSRVYNAWANIFYREGFRLIVECDSHTSKTTWPIIPTTGAGNDEGFIRNDARGTVYTGEGSWGAPLRGNNDNKTWTRGSAMVNQFKWIFVDEHKIELRTIQVDNANQVSELPNETPFAIPTNINILALSDGAKVVEIRPIINPKISFSNNMPNTFKDKLNVNISVDFLNSNKVSLSSIEIYNGTTKLTTLTSPPYNFKASLTNGQHKIRAIATAVTGMKREIEKDIFVGDFSVTKEVTIRSKNDDVEESQNGTLINLDGNLEIGRDNPIIGRKMGVQKIGLRFTNIEIPRGATITSAHIQFTSGEWASKNHDIDIKIENETNSVIFKNTPNTVSSRNFLNKSILWKTSGWWTIGQKNNNQKTSNLKELLQTVVNKQSWQSSNNAICFMLTSTNQNSSERRTVVSFDNNNANAPKLIYTYAYSSQKNSANGTTWLGSNTSNWNDNKNWTNGIPKETSETFIVNTSFNNPTLNTKVKVKNIEIENGKVLTITPNGGIETQHINYNQNIIIESSATNSGYLLAKSVSGINQLVYKRHLTKNWHFIGSPVSGQNIKTFAENTDLQTAKGNPNKLGLIKYNSALGYKGWEFYLKNQNWGSFALGKGYGIKVKNTGTKSFKGAISTSNVVFNATGISSNTNELLANPYTAFLSVNRLNNSFIKANETKFAPQSTCVYLWDYLNDRYSVVNDSTTDTYLSPGQGFFVESKQPNEVFVFNTDMLSERKTSEKFYRTEEQSKIVVSISNGKKTTSTEIKFLPNTTSGLDIGYDAAAFNNELSTFKIVSKLVDGSLKNESFMLQCIEKSSIKNASIPLQISSKKTAVKLQVLKYNIPNDIEFQLKNLQENSSQQFKANDIVNIPIQKNQTTNFQLQLGTANTLSNSNNTQKLKESIYIKSISNFIEVGGLTQNGWLRIFEISGKEVLKKRLFNNSYLIDVAKLTSGFYVVQIEISGQVYNKKMFLNL